MSLIKKAAFIGLTIMLTVLIAFLARRNFSTKEPIPTQSEPASSVTTSVTHPSSTVATTAIQPPLDIALMYAQNQKNFSLSAFGVVIGDFISCFNGSQIIKYALDDLSSEVIYETEETIVQIALLNEHSLVVAIAAPSFDGQPRQYCVFDINTRMLRPMNLKGVAGAMQVKTLALENVLIYDVFTGDGEEIVMYRYVPEGETEKIASGSINYFYDNQIYFYAYPDNDMEKPAEHFRCNLDGSGTESLGVLGKNTLILGDLRIEIDDQVNLLMTYDDENIYYRNAAGLHKMNVSTKEKTTITDKVVNNLSIVDGWMYYYAGGTLQKQKTTG